MASRRVSQRNLIEYGKALVQAGVIEEPKWLYALQRTPPLPPAKQGKRPPQISYPEDHLIEDYYRRHPEARLGAVDLTSFAAPPARRFALRQLQLMRKNGWGEGRARSAVEKEFAQEQQQQQQQQQQASAEAARPAAPKPSVIEAIQREEEFHIMQALHTYADSHGPAALQQHAAELTQTSLSMQPPRRQHRPGQGMQRAGAQRGGSPGGPARQQQQQQRQKPAAPAEGEAAKEAPAAAASS